MKIYENVTELIGNTPLVKLNSISNETGATVLGKCEFLNPSHSVKDRIAYGMIKEALKSGKMDRSSVVIEPTSGNTGIGLAMVCASMEIKLILTMPESMSIERRKLLSAFGAKLELTPDELGMKGATVKAKEFTKKIKISYMPMQFSNEINPRTHRLTTAKEILDDTDGKVDIFVAAVGTGGTLSGVGEALKKLNSDTLVIAVEPDLSPILSGGKASAHKIQGIGAGFIPQTLNDKIYDEVIQVSFEEAVATSRDLAKKDGLLVGISSGANVYAAAKIAKREANRGKTIVTILCDTGERYLSSGLYE